MTLPTNKRLAAAAPLCRDSISAYLTCLYDRIIEVGCWVLIQREINFFRFVCQRRVAHVAGSRRRLPRTELPLRPPPHLNITKFIVVT